MLFSQWQPAFCWLFPAHFAVKSPLLRRANVRQADSFLERMTPVLSVVCAETRRKNPTINRPIGGECALARGFAIGAMVIGLLLAVSGCSSHEDAGAAHTASQAEAASEDESVNSFVLSSQKQSVAGIQLGEVVEQRLQAQATVPGRVQYDDSRHIEVKIPTAGILLEVRVKPGSRIDEGDVLALVSSPEVGTARADVLKRKVEFDLALQKFEWKDAACNGLKQLVAAVNAGQDPQTVSEDLSALKLGTYRAEIVAAYSRYRLAQSLAAAVAGNGNSGALPGRTIQERLSERDTARAALAAVIEQSLFQATQDRDIARLELTDSDRRLKISRQMVQTLLGSSDPIPAEIDEEQLSLVEIHAPIGGTIESRTFSKRERLKQGDTLFVLANTSQLWVAAEIRELEWRALSLQPGETLKITSPALPGQQLTARLEYVGREVDPQSNAIPLVAVVSNTEGLLRPGQFVWVQLPLGAAYQGLAIPESAVVQHEGQSFLFVPEGENHFRRVNVQTGIQQGNLVEVVTGVKPGMQIVTSGAFALKSEMLLEREE